MLVSGRVHTKQPRFWSLLIWPCLTASSWILTIRWPALGEFSLAVSVFNHTLLGSMLFGIYLPTHLVDLLNKHQLNVGKYTYIVDLPLKKIN